MESINGAYVQKYVHNMDSVKKFALDLKSRMLKVLRSNRIDEQLIKKKLFISNLIITM